MILHKTHLLILHFVDLFKSYDFHFGITTITPNYSHNTCNLNSAHSFNPACLFEVGQEAYCTICKFQFTRVNVQGSTYKNSTNKNVLQASEPLQPYFKSRKGISQTSLRRGILNKIHRQFFSYDSRNVRKQKNTTYKLRTRTTFQRFLNQEFFFGSRVAAFSRDPSC
jgi:hypothetical protein